MPNDTRADALDLGVIGLDPTVNNDQIGFRIDGKPERNDFYKFTLEQDSDFNLTLDKLDANANVQVLDDDGSIVFQSKKGGKKREVIDADLEAGDYFVRVLPKGGAQTDYRLSLSADPIPVSADDLIPGIALGVLGEEETVVSDQDIGFTRGGQRDTVDYFNFSLAEESDISLTLDQLKRNADVQIWDGEGKTLLFQSRNKGSKEETINAILEKGDYVVKVDPKNAAKTSYRLGLSADKVDPPDQPPGYNVGDLANPLDPVFVLSDVGFSRGGQKNQRDYYTFEVSKDVSFYGELDDLQRDANIYLYEYDPSKKGKKSLNLLNESTKKGTNTDTISEFLEVGEYAVEVRPKNGAKTDYRLELDADINVDDIPTRELAEDLGELVEEPTNRKNNVGLLTGQRFRDQEDWYKFSLSTEKNVDMTVDEFRVNAANVEIYDDKGNRLYRSKNKGRAPELTNETFDAGDYYVRVVARGGSNTDYRLSLSAGEGGPDIEIFPLGTLPSSYDESFTDKIGGELSGVRNELDKYTFTLTESTEFLATLDQIKQNVNLELYQDDDLVASSQESGRTEELISENLEPGDYSLRIIPVGNAETKYRLGIETESLDPTVGTDTFEVGSLISRKNNEYKNKDDIGFTKKSVRNTNDVYNFTLDSDSNFTLTLDQLKRDANVIVLDDEDNIVLSGLNPGNAPEFVNGFLDAGDYSVQVFPLDAAKTDYFLKMNADPISVGPDPGDSVDPVIGEDPDGTLATATDLGNYQPLLEKTGKVGFTEDGYDDLKDYYKFMLPASGNAQIVLDDLDQNADLSLLASDGAVIATSSSSGNTTEFLNVLLGPGDYYVQVAAIGSAQTDYTLQFF